MTAFRQFTRLMQDEIALAKAELSRSAARAGVGLALIAGSAILALVALNVLAGALVAFVASAGLTAGMAALIVGGGLLLLAIMLVVMGKSRLSADALTPDRTARNIKRDIDTLKEASHG